MSPYKCAKCPDVLSAMIREDTNRGVGPYLRNKISMIANNKTLNKMMFSFFAPSYFTMLCLIKNVQSVSTNRLCLYLFFYKRFIIIAPSTKLKS